MSPRIFSTAATVFIAMASPLLAHPGHEHPVTPPAHPMHWFIEPEHLLGWIGIACVVAVFYGMRKFFFRRSATSAREKHPH